MFDNSNLLVGASNPEFATYDLVWHIFIREKSETHKQD